MANDIILNATAQDAIITYTNPLLTLPVIISGSGIEDRINIDDIEDIVTEIGTDNTMSAHYKAVLIKGKLTLQPLSLALLSIRKVLEKQGILKVVIPGTLTVASPSGLWQYTLNNVVFTTKFKGFELGDKVKDVVIAFNAKAVDATVLGGILSSALNLGGVGGLV